MYQTFLIINLISSSFYLYFGKTIALRMDVLGCYHPVSVTEPTIHAQTTPSPEFSHCRLCPNMPQDQLNIEHCACPPSLLWDGKQCIMPAFCPCFDGPMKYPVGAMFHNQQNCSSCVCTLGGVSDCRLNSQTCAPCEKGYVAETKAPQCQCSCRRCEPGTRPCHSTNVCLDEALWCNGNRIPSNPLFFKADLFRFIFIE